MGTVFLQIFLGIDIFIIGGLAVIAAQHAYAHFRPEKPEPQKPSAPAVQLPAEVREHLAKAAQARFEAAINHSTQKLQHDLGVTVTHIDNLVLRLATEVVSGELERYRQNLAKMHEQADKNLSGISQEVAKHQSEIEARMAQELEAEKQRLIKQIDIKLADAVGSFLTETLGHNIDLGAQNQYLVDQLEAHKAELVKEVGDENQAAG